MELSYTKDTIIEQIKSNVSDALKTSKSFQYVTVTGDIFRIADVGKAGLSVLHKDTERLMPLDDAYRLAVEVIRYDMVLKLTTGPVAKSKSSGNEKGAGGLSRSAKVGIGLGTVAVIGAAAAAYILWPEATTETASALIGG